MVGCFEALVRDRPPSVAGENSLRRLCRFEPTTFRQFQQRSCGGVDLRHSSMSSRQSKRRNDDAVKRKVAQAKVCCQGGTKIVQLSQLEFRRFQKRSRLAIPLSTHCHEPE